MTESLSEGPAKAPGYGKKLILFGLLFTLVTVGITLAIIFALDSQPFESLDEITPDKIANLNVRTWNRRELDGGDNVKPFDAAPDDYALLLSPLQQAKKVDVFTGTRGPFLGEYRIHTQEARRGNVKFYFVPQSSGPAKLRFQIGPHLYEGGDPNKFVKTAEAASARGKTK